MLDLGLWTFLLCSGCAPFGPHYKRAPVETPATFKEQASSATAAGQWTAADPKDALAKGNWWEIFHDRRLDDLEEKALVANQNIKQAEAQYRQALEAVKAERASYLPTVTTNPSATRGFGPNGGARSSSKLGTFNDFTLPVSASWEPDLWGQITLTVRNAKASAQATAAQLQNMRLSIQATLAADYFLLESTDMELDLLNSAITSYQEALKLTQVRFNGGIASQAEVAQAQTQLETTRAQATDLAITRAQYEHAIAVLVGQPPSTFSLPSAAVLTPPPAIPPGVPAQLLERRPDIASAERLMAAANANVGLTRTAFFPTIALTAEGGFESGSFVNWLSWPNRFWAIGVSAAQTIFDFGKRLAESRAVKDQYDATVAQYRQTVLAAFQDTEDNLAALRLFDTEAAQQGAAVKASEESLRLEIIRYKAGVDSFLNVITTENIALSDERTAVELVGRRMSATVSLIRSLGGGWDVSQLPWKGDIPEAPKDIPNASPGVPNPPLPLSLMAAPSVPAPAPVPAPPTVSTGATAGFAAPSVSTAPAPAAVVPTTGTNVSTH